MRTTNYPCVKGQMGDWTYYTTVMKVSDVVQYVKFAENVCPNRQLDMMIQREVTARSKQIADYLQTNEQRFFGSLIVAVYDGEPKFLPISFTDASLLSELEGKIGILRFDGSEQYYAIDGQHRLAALIEVISKNPERYKFDEVSIVVVCHSKDLEGMARARRLFTTVNRYAKKTSPVTNIVMDEDDGVAIITRRLIREKGFFSHRIKLLNEKRSGQSTLATGESMQTGDKQHLMAISTLYECNKYLLPASMKPDFAKPQQCPPFEILEEGFAKILERWNLLIESVDVWKQLQDTSVTLEKFRHNNGGNVLVRPVGIASFISAVGYALDSSISYESIASCANKHADITKVPWNGVLWNSTSNRMLAGKERKSVSGELWGFFFGLEKNYEELNSKWRSFVDPRNENRDLNLENQK